MSFTWGAGGQPEDVMTRRRRLAEELVKQGIDASPVQHWTQGAARVAQALMGAYEMNKLDAEDKQYNAETERQFGKLPGGASPSGEGGSQPMPAASGTGAPIKIGDPTPVQNEFIEGIRGAGLTNPNGLAAVAATGLRESGFQPGNMNRSWSDPSESGQAGTAGGIMSWRGPRLQALQGFARQQGEEGLGSPRTQAAFLAQEDPELIPRLNAAKTPQEANQIMANAWRFAGYNRQGGELARRDALTAALLPRFAGAPATPAPGGVDVANNEQDVQRLEAQMAQAGGVQSDMPATGSAPAQGQIVVPGQATPAQPGGNVPSMAELTALSQRRLNPAQKAIVGALMQKRIALDTRDPQEAELRRLQIDEKRKNLGRVEMETVTAPDGTIFEREKGKAGAQWAPSLKLPSKPEERTTDQRELAQVNDERKAANLPPLRMDEYKVQKAKAGAANTSIDLSGGSSKQVFDEMKERATAAQTAVTGLNALREARKAVQGGGFFGAGADTRLAFAKVGQLLGFDDGRIVNTETFRSAVAPQVAAIMKATVGSTQISNADRDFAEKAAGGSIQLDEKSINRLLDIMERGSGVIIDGHRELIDSVYPETEDGKFRRERALFGVRVPKAAQISQDQPSPAKTAAPSGFKIISVD